jgi:hypothetical protein
MLGVHNTMVQHKHHEGVGEIKGILDARIRREHWGLFLHSKEFQERMDGTFYSVCNLKPSKTQEGEEALDASEMQMAMDILHEQLSHEAGGLLPKSRETSSTLLPQFDLDGSGELDLDEFRRFAQVYFNRLKWPMWQIYLKGAAIGLGTALGVRFVVLPITKPVAARIAKLVVPKVVGAVNKAVTSKLGLGLRTLGSKANPFTYVSPFRRRLSRQEKELQKEKERLQKIRERRLREVKNLLVASLVGGLAAMAGLV